MIKATQIRKGMVILHESQPCKVVHFKHTVTGRGSASIPAKLKNILDGSTSEVTFRSDDKVEKVFLSEEDMEFLYVDGDDYVFMNQESYEQISINKEEIEEITGYLVENAFCKIDLYEGKPIGVTPPTNVQLTVEDTEPVIKGATAAGNVTKPATLQTGLTIQVPMFVDKGDTVIVNTVTGEYSGRPGRN
ncbi:MAG: elongation factor P [Chitinivibrionales bacterium]|nr:elongation factor P [Chitinivibrionales bacterium]